MPTTISEGLHRPSTPSWREVARLYVLLVQVRWIDALLNFLYRGGRSPQGEKLLRLMRRWLDAHEAMAAILRRPAPPHVEQVRVILRGLHRAPAERRAVRELRYAQRSRR